jgi:hypothetical protein
LGSLGGALAYFITGALFVGLMRVTRWIVVGR